MSRAKASAIVRGLLYMRARTNQLTLRDKLELAECLSLRHVVCVTNRPDPAWEGLARVHYWHWPMSDGARVEPLLVEQIAAKIDAWMGVGQPVLVYCESGNNRSGLVCARALMLWVHDSTARDAIWIIREQRPKALNNQHFVRYLEAQDGRA